ncbi:putative transposase, YhgA-like [Pelotomaculum schinkii]|uniref:Putative transposase, YhgA-like n=1 Tax=Pelotomaculum schinkii TaxID=78350 RepID=A0A4Y7RAH5_9FIRM|nr:Rpn family recombination-promoting nuclease/putative transposase [Pelotomaculum schinkii]TEB05673.1 putative transposase, YhgA-like [Pelotomaculum schinkii]
MAEYDHLIKAITQRYTQHIAALVRGMEVMVEHVIELDKEAVSIQRMSDALFKVNEDGYEYLMLVEFQTRPDREMSMRMMEYTAIHHRRYGKPVYPVVVNLTGRGIKERYSFDCLDLTVMSFKYHQVNLRELSGTEYLYRGLIGLIPFVPLMKHRELPEKVLEKCAQRLESEVPDEEERSTMYLALGVMASLKFPKNLILRVLEVSRMENSPLFDGIREEWEARGIEKGRIEGERRGEIRGELRGRLDLLFDLIETKFGAVPDSLREQLIALKEPDAIKEVVRKAVSSGTIEEFIATLKQ